MARIGRSLTSRPSWPRWWPTGAATLIDNVRLFEERSDVARALQESLLPGSLPHIPGLQLGARYQAAGHGMEVGGDFYDAFHADDNWWVVAGRRRVRARGSRRRR